MVKILAINGSHRGDKGSTQYLIDLLADGARSEGADFETVVLARKKINRCLGCFKCEEESHLLRCIFDEKDDVQDIFKQMREADLIIYATPVYIFTMSSLMKIFLERFMSTGHCGQLKATQSGLFFHHIDEQLGSLPFVALICCDNIERRTPQNVVDYFQTFSQFMDAPLAGMLVRNASQSFYQAQDPAVAVRFKNISGVQEAYRQAGKELARKMHISKRTEKRANQDMLPIPGMVRWLMNFRIKKIKEQAVLKAQGLVAVKPEKSSGQ